MLVNGELGYELDSASLRMLEIPPSSSLPPCQVVTRKTKERYVVSTVHTNETFFYEYPADCLTSLFLLIKNKQTWGDSGTVVEKSFSNQKVACSIPCRSVLKQDTEPLIAPDVQCAISVKCKMCIHCKSHICKSLWIKASAKCKCKCKVNA